MFGIKKAKQLAKILRKASKKQKQYRTYEEVHMKGK